MGRRTTGLKKVGELSPRARERRQLIADLLSRSETTCAGAQSLYRDAVINRLVDHKIRRLAKAKGVDLTKETDPVCEEDG